MSRQRVVVLGGNFGGLTAALAVRHELHGDVDVTVVSASDRFLFNPSLIWLPFGKRAAGDITFPLAPTFDAHGVEFVHAEATSSTWRARRSRRRRGGYDYDYLVIATGYRNNFDGVARPRARMATPTRSPRWKRPCTPGEGWRRFLDDPGDIVIGAAPGAGCFGAAYEYLFNVSHQLRKAGLKKQVNLTYVIGGAVPGALRHRRAAPRRVAARHVLEEGAHHRGARHRHRLRRRGPVVLADGAKHEFAYAMIVPPFVGQEVIARATGDRR